MALYGVCSEGTPTLYNFISFGNFTAALIPFQQLEPNEQFGQVIYFVSRLVTTNLGHGFDISIILRSLFGECWPEWLVFREGQLDD